MHFASLLLVDLPELTLPGNRGSAGNLSRAFIGGQAPLSQLPIEKDGEISKQDDGRGFRIRRETQLIGTRRDQSNRFS